MSALKPVFRELREAVLTGFSHARHRLHVLADNLDGHIDDIARRVRANDTPDGGGTLPGDGHISDAPRPAPSPFPDLPPAQRQDPDLVDWDLVNEIDTATARDGATFWSGRILDANGDTIPDGTQLGAQHLTDATHGETLEQLLDRQGFTDRMPSDWNDPSTDATWREVSTRLAAGASGDVRAYLGDVRATSVWIECELPTLAVNPAVTSVTTIDAVTGDIVAIFTH